MEYEALKRSIEHVLQVYIKEIGLESTFAGDLGADSIDMVQIFRDTEQELGIQIPDVDFEKIITVQDALDIIRECSGGTVYD